MDDRRWTDQHLRTCITQLKNPDYHIRYRAVFTLGKLNDTRAIPILIEALGDFDKADEESKVNRTAGAALIRYGEQARDALITALAAQPDHPHDSWRRYWTADTLRFFPSQATTEALIKLLQDTDRSAVEGAVESIIQLQVFEALSSLRQLYDQRPFPDGYIYSVLQRAIKMLST